MAKYKIFLDTDVVIASLLSKTKTGASYLLINDKNIEKIVSHSVVEEVKYVSKRYGIDRDLVNEVINKFEVFKFKLTKKQTKYTYGKYVLDQKDSHVVAGAHMSNSKYLLTFNTKHYLSTDIKIDLKIFIKRPGEFLQHLNLN